MGKIEKAHKFSPKYVPSRVIQHKGYSFELIGTSPFIWHMKAMLLFPLKFSCQNNIVR